MYRRSIIYYFVFLSFLVSGMGVSASAQLKIGDNPKSIQPASLLELESDKKGLLLTRLSDTLLINTLNPPNGMVIFYNNGVHQAMMIRHYNRWADVVTADSVGSYLNPIAKNISSNSPVLTIQGGTGATLQAVMVNLDTAALGHLLTTSPVNDSLAIALVTGATYDTLLSVINNNSIVKADNGLTKVGNTVVLGGTLTQPSTTIIASATNTLAITGLQNGNAATTDSVIVSEAGTGILKKVAPSNLLDGQTVIYTATAGQTDFATPTNITNKFKVNVYRNGVNIEFNQIDANHVRVVLEDPGDKCFAGDEIKIIQFF